jgi:hypothetical protein
MLTRLGVVTGDLIIEGSFAGNPLYAALLAALRPSQQVFAGSDAAGTARVRRCCRDGRWRILNRRD